MSGETVATAPEIVPSVGDSVRIRLTNRLPADPRCKLCASPFRGPLAPVLRLIGKKPFPGNPKYCQFCFTALIKKRAGAEVESSYLFADVRGSTTLAGAATSPVTLTLGGQPLPQPGKELQGELGASYDLLTEDLPDYLGKLNGFVTELVTQTNTQHAAGKDLDGNDGAPFFAGTTAAGLAVAITDPRAVAAAQPGKGALDASNADALATMDLGAIQYRSLVTQFGVQVSSARRVADNQGVLTSQVDASRESLAGINIDEEMVNLLAAQRAYEGAARVITAIDSVLDTLINRTGLMR